MLATRVFLRAIVFSVRTSDDVHERRFDFLGIPITSEWKGRDLVARICWKEKQKNAAKGCRTIPVISLRRYSLRNHAGTEKCDWTMVTRGG